MDKTQQTSTKQIMPSSMDRLSAFPDDILCHILSFLPTKTSVSTSILAHRWRFLWAHVPNLKFHQGRDETPKIDTICNKVMLQYRVKNMNSLRLFADDDDTDDTDSYRSQLTSCIQDAIDRNVKEIHLFFNTECTFPNCIFNCKTLVSLRLGGYIDIALMTGDDLWLPALKKLFLSSVGYECEESLPYLLSRCPVLEELTVHRLYPDDVYCFVVSSRTINKLILNSAFYGHLNMNNKYTMKIDAPELRYLRVEDFASKDIKCGSMTSLIEADVNLNGDDDDDDDDDCPFQCDASVEDDVNDGDDDDASVGVDANNVADGDDDEFVEDDANVVSDDDDDEFVEDDANVVSDDDDDEFVEDDANVVSDDDDEFVEDDANGVYDDGVWVEGDDNNNIFDNDAPEEGDNNNEFPNENALNNEAAPVERRAVLYARSVFEFLGGLCNVKYLKLSTCYMGVTDSAFSTWTVKYNNLIELELRCDWRFITIFLEAADNLQVLRICTSNRVYKYWIEPNEVPPCLLTHLETIRFDHFEIAEAEMTMIKYILKNARVLKRMEIHIKDSGIDLEKRSEAFNSISLFERGSMECILDFH